MLTWWPLITLIVQTLAKMSCRRYICNVLCIHLYLTFDTYDICYIYVNMWHISKCDFWHHIWHLTPFGCDICHTYMYDIWHMWLVIFPALSLLFLNCSGRETHRYLCRKHFLHRFLWRKHFLHRFLWRKHFLHRYLWRKHFLHSYLKTLSLIF